MHIWICSILFAAIVVNYGASIVCNNTSCVGVTCKESEPICSNNQEIGETSCGCCKTCINIIPLGGSCFWLYFRGTPQTSKCVDGSICNNGTCSPIILAT